MNEMSSIINITCCNDEDYHMQDLSFSWW